MQESSGTYMYFQGCELMLTGGKGNDDTDELHKHTKKFSQKMGQGRLRHINLDE